MIDKHKVLGIAENAANKSGEFLMLHFGATHQLHHKSGLLSDVYSRYDKESNEIIIQTILSDWFELYPDLPLLILSEESVSPLYAAKGNDASYFCSDYKGDIEKWDGYCFVIDPICGSVAYARGLRDFIISVALVKGNTAILSAVFDPVHREMFTAVSTEGSFLNGNRINPSNVTKLSEAVVSLEHRFYREAPAESIKNIAMSARRLRTAMTCALELCYVACGRIDAVIKLDQEFYDYIGGALILDEALSGKIGLMRFKGNKPVLPFDNIGSKTGFIGTNGHIYDELNKLL